MFGLRQNLIWLGESPYTDVPLETPSSRREAKMNDEIDYKNNPLHGLSLKNLLIEIVDHYGYEILYAYLNLNCFKTNADIMSSVKFLKKTDWAREKVESFYLYQFKSLPRCSRDQFELPPRDRIVPDTDIAGEPVELSLEDAQRLQEKRAKKAADFSRGRSRSNRNYANQSVKERAPRPSSRLHSEEKPPSNSESEQPSTIWAQAMSKKFD